MRVLGRRSDGALHLSIGGGLSIILRGGYASPPSQTDVVTRLGPWYRATSFDPNMQRKVELRLDRSRTVPLVSLSSLETLGVADDGMWSCPSCGHENTVSLRAGCEWIRCPSRKSLGDLPGHEFRGNQWTVRSDAGHTVGKAHSAEDAANQAKNYEDATGRRAQVIPPAKVPVDPNEMADGEDFEHGQSPWAADTPADVAKREAERKGKGLPANMEEARAMAKAALAGFKGIAERSEGKAEFKAARPSRDRAAAMAQQRRASGGVVARKQRERDFQMERGRQTQRVIRAIRERDAKEIAERERK